MEKAFRIAILFCEDDHSHNALALDIFERLKEPSSYGLYSPALISSRFDERDFRFNMLEVMKKKYDLLVPIGNYFTTLTDSVCKELDTVVQTVFVAVTESVALGLIQSFKSPGGYISGVIFADESPTIYAQKVALLRPRVSKILVPYGPARLSGLLEKRAEETAGSLQAAGVQPVLVPICSAEEVLTALDENIDNVDAIMLLEGCFSIMVIAMIVARAWPKKKLVISAGGADALCLGATAAYGRSHSDIAHDTVKMIHRTLGERMPLANQPVVVLPSNRAFVVNEALLQQAGDADSLLTKLHSLGVVVVRFWPAPPLDFDVEGKMK